MGVQREVFTPPQKSVERIIFEGQDATDLHTFLCRNVTIPSALQAAEAYDMLEIYNRLSKTFLGSSPVKV